jgi:hypothetical protein
LEYPCSVYVPGKSSTIGRVIQLDFRPALKIQLGYCVLRVLILKNFIAAHGRADYDLQLETF